ncbi:LssY C-terminal domain-containing protein [Subtercola endophyticus]|uniref:LssY C-terminal domain-containing protein n=1 Tax=Subtercola endophyticus TaxID=2895559 RepID=UPI001E415777|nr:LssY C-terminal domain-containing protein [Subtercola endophyticus]UFS58424.1 LssY C-terminal domain-containing protein [Subtercola endophyticus]
MAGSVLDEAGRASEPAPETAVEAELATQVANPGHPEPAATADAALADAATADAGVGAVAATAAGHPLSAPHIEPLERKAPTPFDPAVASASLAPALPPKRDRRERLIATFDNVFFFLGAAAAAWLAYLVLSQSFSHGLEYLWFLIVFYAVLAYLLLPRLHSMLTHIYVPDYFIGRARTNEGLLGDPVNLSLFGSEAQLHTAMLAAGWHRADEVGFRSALRIVTSTLTRRSYSDAPVSPLYLFGQIQDFTYQQEVDGNPAKRHHVRFWKTPEGWLLPGGYEAEWMAAGTYDRNVGISLFTLQVTHRIERETDRERDHIVTTLRDANPEGVFTVIRNFSTGYHAVNGGGDAITTDGDLPIVDLRGVPVSAEGAASAEEVDAAPLPADASLLGQVVLTTARDSASSNRVKRPISIYLSYLLMIIRGAIGAGSVIAVFADWADSVASVRIELPSGAGVDADQLADIAVWIIVGLASAAFIGYIVLAQLVFVGYNWARFLVMTLSLITVAGVAVDFVNRQADLTLATGLINLTFDILVLFALSSADARVFTRERRLRRKARRAARAATALAAGAAASAAGQGQPPAIAAR